MGQAPVEARPPRSRTARPAAGRGLDRPNLARWLRFERDTVVAATTVGRWFRNMHARRLDDLDLADGFDAAAALERNSGPATGSCAFLGLARPRTSTSTATTFSDCGPMAPPSASATGLCATSTDSASTAPRSPAGSGSTPMAKRSRPRRGSGPAAPPVPVATHRPQETGRWRRQAPAGDPHPISRHREELPGAPRADRRPRRRGADRADPGARRGVPEGPRRRGGAEDPRHGEARRPPRPSRRTSRRSTSASGGSSPGSRPPARCRSPERTTIVPRPHVRRRLEQAGQFGLGSRRRSCVHAACRRRSCARS